MRRSIDQSDDVKMIGGGEGRWNFSSNFFDPISSRKRKKKKERKSDQWTCTRDCALRSSADPRIIGAPYRRISLLISQVDVSRRSVIHIDPLSLAPPTQPAGWSCFCWLNHHPGLSKRAFHLSLGTVLAPRTRFVPFEQQVPLVASIFDVHPPTWHRLHASSRIFLARSLSAPYPLRDFRIFFFLARWKLFVVSRHTRREILSAKKLENFSKVARVVLFHWWSLSPTSDF